MYPIIKNWQLFFGAADGRENRNRTARAFVLFWNDVDKSHLIIPGKCIIGGNICGQKGYDYGAEFFTPNIVSIDRIDHDEEQYGVAHDLMRASTEKEGEYYYFYSNEHNNHMMQLIISIIHAGELITIPGFYMDKKYAESGKFI